MRRLSIVGSWLILGALLLTCLCSCGGGGDQAGSSNSGALSAVQNIQAALQHNSPNSVRSFFAPTYSYLGETQNDAASDLFSGFSVLSSLQLQSVFQFSAVSLNVQSDVSQGAGQDELVVAANFSGAWTPFSLNAISHPTLPAAVGSALGGWGVQQGTDGVWRITRQRLLSSAISTRQSTPPTLGGIQINGSAAPPITSAQNLHVTGNVGSASAVVVVPDISTTNQTIQVLDVSGHTRSMSLRGRATIGDINGLLQQLSAQLGSFPGPVNGNFAADVSAPAAGGDHVMTVLALTLDQDRNVTGQRVITVPYSVTASGGGATGGTSAVIATPKVGKNPVAIAVDSGIHKAYVVNQADNTLSIIDGMNNVTTVAVGSMPAGVAVNLSTHQVFVVNSGDNTVTILDGSSGAVLKTVPVGQGPAAIAVNPTTNKVYLSNTNDNTVSVLDGGNGFAAAAIPVGMGPTAIAVDPGTNKAYVVNSFESTVSAIDGMGTVTGPITVGHGATPQIAIDTNAHRVYVTNTFDNTISVIDEATNTPVTVPVGQGPVALAVNPVTAKVYVLDAGGSNTVNVVDGKTNTLTATLIVASPTFAAVNTIANQVYVADATDNILLIIDGAANKSLTKVPVGTQAIAGLFRTIAVDESAQKVYVINQSDNTVSVIDTAQAAAVR